MLRSTWARLFLVHGGFPPSSSNVAAVIAWINFEGTSATWNPLATTQYEPGATAFNKVGVRNYPSMEVGILGTVATLYNGNPTYGPIRAALRSSAGTDVVCAAVSQSQWGSHPDPSNATDGLLRADPKVSGARLDSSQVGGTSQGRGPAWNPTAGSTGSSLLHPFAGVSAAFDRFTATLQVDFVSALRGAEVFAGATLVLGGIAVLVAAATGVAEKATTVATRSILNPSESAAAKEARRQQRRQEAELTRLSRQDAASNLRRAQAPEREAERQARLEQTSAVQATRRAQRAEEKRAAEPEELERRAQRLKLTSEEQLTRRKAAAEVTEESQAARSDIITQARAARAASEEGAKGRRQEKIITKREASFRSREEKKTEEILKRRVEAKDFQDIVDQTRKELGWTGESPLKTATKTVTKPKATPKPKPTPKKAAPKKVESESTQFLPSRPTKGVIGTSESAKGFLFERVAPSREPPTFKPKKRVPRTEAEEASSMARIMEGVTRAYEKAMGKGKRK